MLENLSYGDLQLKCRHSSFNVVIFIYQYTQTSFVWLCVRLQTPLNLLSIAILKCLDHRDLCYREYFVPKHTQHSSTINVHIQKNWALFRCVHLDSPRLGTANTGLFDTAGGASPQDCCFWSFLRDNVSMHMGIEEVRASSQWLSIW